jgi:hypothetical protein
MPTPFHWYSSPRKDLFHPPTLFFFNYIDSSRGGHLGTSCLYMSCFFKLPTSHYLLFLYHHTPLIFNSLQCGTLYYNHIRMDCFNIFQSLTFYFSLLPPIITSDRSTHAILCSLNIYIYMIIYVFIYPFNL